MSGNSVSVDESQEYQGQPEEVCVISPQNGTSIGLTVTSASDPMLVNIPDDELVLTISPIEIPKPYLSICCCYFIFFKFYSEKCLNFCTFSFFWITCCFNTIFQRSQEHKINSGRYSEDAFRVCIIGICCSYQWLNHCCFFNIFQKTQENWINEERS